MLELYHAGLGRVALTLYHNDMSVCAQKVRMALAEKGLADIAYAPYVTRLDQLEFGGMIEARPKAASWYDRIRARPAYRCALAQWFNEKYLPLMAEKGAEAWPRVQAMLAL